jgi:hypothetical protein
MAKASPGGSATMPTIIPETTFRADARGAKSFARRASCSAIMKPR